MMPPSRGPNQLVHRTRRSPTPERLGSIKSRNELVAIVRVNRLVPATGCLMTAVFNQSSGRAVSVRSACGHGALYLGPTPPLAFTGWKTVECTQRVDSDRPD